MRQLCEFFNEAIHCPSVQFKIVVHMQMRSQHSPHRCGPSMPRLHKRHPLCRSLPSGPPKAGSVLTSTKLRAFPFACQSRAPVTLHTLERHHQSACASCTSDAATLPFCIYRALLLIISKGAALDGATISLTQGEMMQARPPTAELKVLDPTSC